LGGGAEPYIGTARSQKILAIAVKPVFNIATK